MIGNRVFVWGLFILCSVLAGCIGAPFSADAVSEADTEAGDGGGSLDPLNGDAGTPSTDDAGARADAGTVPADAASDAGARIDGSPAEVADAGPHGDATPSDAASTDAGTCDGGPLYLHHVGLMGLTWQDCVPTGTYDATQALQACAVYLAATTPGEFCQLAAPRSSGCGSSVDFGGEIFWTYDGQYDGQTQAATGHVKDETNGTIGCPSSTDPEWD
jgi:hypothetical protein